MRILRVGAGPIQQSTPNLYHQTTEQVCKLFVDHIEYLAENKWE